MKKKNSYTILAGWLWLMALQVQGQDIHLSQFYETPLLRNPALAGIFTGDIRIQAVYRNQWNNVTIPYQTATLSGEWKMPIGRHNDFVTAALQMSYDRAGASRLQSTQLLPTLNYHKSLSESRSMFLALGFMGGFVQRQFDPSKLSFDNQYTNGRYDPAAPSGENFARIRYTYPDAGVGISFNSTIRENIHYFLGVAYYHFNRPKLSFFSDNTISLNPKWVINAGIAAPLSEKVKLIAHFNQLQQGSYAEIMGGALLGYGLLTDGIESNRMIYGGLFIRLNDALVPVIKLDMGLYEVALSYDTNISKLKNASQGMGGFELSLVFKDFLHNQNASIEKTICPRF